ncbi:hypothetical protein Kpol_1053p43 [Vanderwaltozyma polyspora DSM 70294]|uniref:Ras-GAP domain-containing protein n=1 Tax=Vanderwaltozyma polyspora (strain ATCC 22028 / DSM 70294 / BCRC 21397 / CBS 2163 / NBRC 10782 / NRRL Y-8283 / UCD 57-17) TaxID=436907 RepID=A7TN87_VANPO|nr:uncharacterized protein Kpol_1053p43 [Vanderwaltozyma polyspora DSM 70294]EDO16305.1 hypothetical protein Kpol_1053p43 [Vanderwaltozyma polyspora DSM 70294]
MEELPNDQFMVNTLLKHLYFDRLFPMLPIESALSTYREVESDLLFLSCRSVILNVAISQDLGPVVQQTLDLIDLILRNENINSPNITEDAIHSIFVMIRLLSDVMEYYWDSNEGDMLENDSRNEQIDASNKDQNGRRKSQIPIGKQKSLFTGTIVGYSTHRPNFHTSRPASLNPELAKRLVYTCSRVKFSRLTCRVLSNISQNFSHYTVSSIDNISPNYRYFKNNPSLIPLIERIDLTVDYIQRFVAASNPTEFFQFIKSKALSPSLKKDTESWNEIVCHYDLMGCIFLSKRSFPKFFEVIKSIVVNLKKSIFSCLFLYYSSKALMYWFMARPKEYEEIILSFKELSRIESDSKEKDAKLSETLLKAKHLSNLSTSLFDEIYSVFAVPNMLTSSTSSSNSSTTSNLNSSSNNLSIHINTGVASLHTSSSISPSVTHPPREQTTTPGSVKSNLSNVSSTQSAQLISNPVSPAVGSIGRKYHPPNTSELLQPSPNPSSHASTIDDMYSYSTCTKGDESTDSSELSTQRSIDQASTRPMNDIFHLINVLDLYTTFDESESLIHTSVLRFLSVLLLLDPDVFSEINTIPFKYIRDAAPESSRALIDKEKEREKALSMKHLTHGLRKLTTLTPQKVSKPVKFLTSLMRIYNGSHSSSDLTLLDSIRALLSLFTVSSAVALRSNKLPAAMFASRLIDSFGINLEIGKDWNAPLIPNIVQCLNKHKRMTTRFQLEYFAASLQLETHTFLEHLNLEAAAKEMDTDKLVLYTEGLRVFFHLPNFQILRRKTAIQTAPFFKGLFSNVSDIILKDFPYFNEYSVSEIVASIMEGTLIDKFGAKGVSIRSSPSSLSSMISPSPATKPSQATSPVGMDSGWTQHPIIPTSSNSSDLSDISSSTVSNVSEMSFSNLISPRARRVSGNSGVLKRSSLLASQGDLENKGSSDSHVLVSNGFTSATPIQPAVPRTIRSPIRPPPLPKRNKDDSSVKVTKQTLNTSSDPNMYSISDIENARRVMLNIFSIFKRTANFFLLPDDNTLSYDMAGEDFKLIIKPIFIAIIDSSKTLESTAQSFMNVLIKFMSELDATVSSPVLNAYYLFCSYSVTLFSSALFDLNLTNNKREILLDIVSKLLQVKSILGKIAEETKRIDFIKDSEEKTFNGLVGSVGRGLFVSLHTNKGNVQKLLTKAYLEYYQTLSFHKNNIGNLEDKWRGNMEFVLAMSKDNYVSSGSVAFQRRLRTNILKYIGHPDEMLLDSIRVIFRKWMQISNTRCLSPEDLADFRSYAGIIASLSGVMLTIAEDGPVRYPFLLEVKMEITKEINHFISKQCSWLNNDDLLTRENSRDILSTELHPLSFKLLFYNLKLKFEEVRTVDLSQDEQSSYFILLEQIIIIIRTILRRDDDQQVLFLFSLDIVNFIDQLVELVEKVDQKSSKYYKIVIHLSKMFRAMKHSEKNLGLAGHYLLKNKWLKLVTKWFKLSIAKEFDCENLSKPHREMDLKRRDLDLLYLDTSIESSKAIAYLTLELPLEIPPALSEEEMRRSSGLIFRNYFGILLKGIEKTTDMKKFPTSLKHKVTILTENLIASLTNLSNSNVEPALQYTLPMGFSENKDIRISFLKVFINVVKNYPNRKSNTEKIKIEATNELLKFLIKYPHLITQATNVCSSAEIDEYTVGLVSAFDTKNAAHILITQLVKDEIQDSIRHMDILRRNSVATRALSLYSRSKGNEYLVKIIGPVLEQMVEDKAYFEVEKLQLDDPNASEQLDLFEKYMKILIDAIIGSIDCFPVELFVVCQVIYSEVRKKFPEYSLVAVGSFVFLRFICPALVSPETENIIGVTPLKEKRSLIQMAKVIQNMANGSDNLLKWPSLATKLDFLKKCNDDIFEFLAELSRTDRVIKIPLNSSTTLPSNVTMLWNLNFFHTFLYMHELQIRKGNLDEMKSFTNFNLLRDSIMLVDRVLGIWGQPVWECRNEIPLFVKENVDRYPQLYEFMSRYAFKRVLSTAEDATYVHESMSSDGFQILTLTFSHFISLGFDVDSIVYRTLQVYARIWSNNHYLVLDCTEFHSEECDIPKLTTLFLSLLPDEAFQHCIGYYFLNVTESFMDSWAALLTMDNPYISHKVPIFFVNTISDQEMINTIGLSPQTTAVLEDVRISLHEINLFEEEKQIFKPVAMRLGNKYFQVLHEEPKKYYFEGFDTGFDIKFNYVYSISQVANVLVSYTKGMPNEFMVTFTDGKKLIFTSPKYLEIVKMFSYALAKIQDDIGISNMLSPITKTKNKTTIGNEKETLSHIILVVLAGLFHNDDVVKNIAYNLLATTQDAFNLNFGIKFRTTPEMYVPDDCTTFLRQLSKAIAESAPELTPHIFKLLIEALENGIIPQDYIPQTVCCMSYWIPNLYKYVYISDEEEGPEELSYMIRVLIRLTISEPHFTSVYLQHIWYIIVLDGRLCNIIVEEVVNHALERDSENRDWTKVLPLLTGLSTVDIACNIIHRLMRIIDSFLPSLKMEVSTQSWSELTILVKIAIPLFFESPMLAQMYLPEVLFIVSLLIDQGPKHIRSCFHQLLMNICHSLAINDSLSEINRKNLDEVCCIFSRQKLKFMFGFSQDKGSVLRNFSISSFASKFNTLEHFTTNIFFAMENADISESAHWKTRYKKYLMDSIFNRDSFLSARAMMILGIIGKSNTSEMLCKNLLKETMKVMAEPHVDDEAIFLLISHVFTYSKIVEGLDPSSNLMKQLFWFATCLTESPHPLIFEGGMLLLSNCLKRMYMLKFEISFDRSKTLSSTLIEARKFAEPVLLELEVARDVTWNIDSFSQVLLSIIIRGLAIPFVKPAAIDCLEQFFKNAYYEYRMHATSTDYLSYLFLLFLISTPDQFYNMLHVVEFEGEMTTLDDLNRIPTVLADWLASDACFSNVALYQGAVLFSSSVSDELTKLRFAIIMRYLLKTNPICVFRFYTVTRNELRRISTLEHNLNSVTVAFELITLLVTYKEFEELQDFNKSSLDNFKEIGLLSVTKIRTFPFQHIGDVLMGIQEQPKLIYERKRLLTMVLGRMACHD